MIMYRLGEKLWKREKRGRQNNDKRLLRWVPVLVNGCSIVQVEVVGMCFDGQALFDLPLCPLFFSAHNLCFIPMFWSSQLHACCVRDTIQNFKGILPTNQSLSVVGKLLPQ